MPIVGEGGMRVSVTASDCRRMLSVVATLRSSAGTMRRLRRRLLFPVVVVDGGKAGSVRSASGWRPRRTRSYPVLVWNKVPVRTRVLGLFLLRLLQKGLVLIVKILRHFFDAHLALMVSVALRRFRRQCVGPDAGRIPHLLGQLLRVLKEAGDVLSEPVGEGLHDPQAPLAAGVRAEGGDRAGALDPHVRRRTGTAVGRRRLLLLTLRRMHSPGMARGGE